MYPIDLKFCFRIELVEQRRFIEKILLYNCVVYEFLSATSSTPVPVIKAIPR